MPWFLEKKGQFFGPFRAEKVLTYAAEGRIKKTTLVSETPDGQNAQPFETVKHIIESGGSFDQLEEAFIPASESVPAAPIVPPPKVEEDDDPIDDFGDQDSGEERDFGQAEDGTAGDWHICTPDRRYGPYNLAHLEALVKQGKLQADDRLQREGQSHLVEVRELFPNQPKKVAEAPKAPASKPKRAAQTKSKSKSKPIKSPSKRRGSAGGMLAAFILTAVIGGAIVWFKPFSQDPQRHGTMPGGEVLASLKRQADKVSPLRKKAAHAELPNFNELATKALAEGIGFHYQREVEPMRERDQKEYESDGPKNFGTYYPSRIRKEVRYILDGGIGFTYLIGADGYVFAVAIDQGSFQRSKMIDVSLSDFAPGARETTLGGHPAYSAEIVKDVCLAHLIWLPDSNSVEALAYMVVEAIPIKPDSKSVR